MKRLDRLIIGELAGPWGFGVGIFTVLIMAGTYLFKVTEYIVSGVPASTVLEFSLLLLPGVMVKTFSMAMLLAALLAFGRLSSDSEVVALRAAGASIGRIMVPVAVFSLIVAGIAFAINETVVPRAALRGTAILKEIEKNVRGGGGQSIHYALMSGNEIQAMIMAKDFNLKEKSLRGVTITVFDRGGRVALFMYAEGMTYRAEDDWEFLGGAQAVTPSGDQSYQLGKTWPKEVKMPPKPEDIAASTLRDLDSFNMDQMAERIAKAKLTPSVERGQIANLEYGYYNKIALPAAAVIFGLVGAPLGIRNHRTGAAAGFWLSVIIIFTYMMLANFMAKWAEGGAIPAYVASFTPLAIGIICAMWLIKQRNG